MSACRSSPHPGAFASGADFAAAAPSHAMQQPRHPLVLTLSLKRAALLASITPIITAVALFVFSATALFHLETVAFAQDRSPVAAPDRLERFIEEGSTRFAVPASLDPRRH
jgi:hypothetical protein